MKKKALALLLCGALLLPVAWQGLPQRQEEGTSILVYYIAADSESGRARGLEGERLAVETEGGPEQTVWGVLRQMRQPVGASRQPALPEEVAVQSLSIYGGSAAIQLSGEYADLPEIRRTLAAAALSQTLLQLDFVDFVKISCERDEYGLESDFYLTEESVILDENPIQYNTFEITLYLIDKKTGQPEQTARTLKTEENGVYPNAVFVELARQPDDENLRSPAPAGMMLRSISTDNGVCILDFLDIGADRLQQLDEASIQAIVATMCAQKGVRGVRLRVEGQPLSHYGIQGYDGVLTP